MYLVLSSKQRHLDEEIGKAREEVARLRSIIEEVKGYEDKKASLEEKIELINNLKTNQKGPVRLMDEVSKALPDLVWLTDMAISGDQLTMKGRTLSPNAVATYLENLKKSPYFAEPVFKNLGREAGPPGDLQLGDGGDLHPRQNRGGAGQLRPRRASPGPNRPAPRAPGRGRSAMAVFGMNIEEKPWYYALGVGRLRRSPASREPCTGSTSSRCSSRSRRRRWSSTASTRRFRRAARRSASCRSSAKRSSGSSSSSPSSSRFFPPKRNTEELIKRIETLTRQGDFTLKKFTPGELVQKEFYSEWPIDIQLEGTYHNLALFFDRMSRFSRIINVEDMKISDAGDVPASRIGRASSRRRSSTPATRRGRAPAGTAPAAAAPRRGPARRRRRSRNGREGEGVE